MDFKNYKAVVTDLDGTLLNSNGELSPFTIEVINEIIKRDIKFYIATGRLYTGAKAVMDELGINIPLITSNGSRILSEKGEELLSIELDLDIVKKLSNMDYKKYGHGIFINGYYKNDWFLIEDKYRNVPIDNNKKFPYYPKKISKDEFENYTFNKIYFRGSHEELLNLEKEILSILSNYVNVSFVSETCLEIFDYKANKANASAFLLEKDNISLEDAIAFGDALNDEQMLDQVGKGFIMGNAIYRLKENLPNLEVIGTSSDDSMAKKLVEIFKL